MSDFRIGGRSGYRQGGVNRNEQQPQGPRLRDGGAQECGAASGFGDAMSPELQARLRQRRPPAPPTGADEQADGQAPGQDQGGFEPTARDRRGPGHGGPHGPKGFEGPHGPHGFGGPHGRHGQGGPERPPVSVDPAQAAAAMVTKFDTDGDGNVTKAEVTAVLEAEEAKRQAQAVTIAPAEAAPVAEPVVDDTTVTPDDALTEEVAPDTTVTGEAVADETATEAVPTAADYAEAQASYVAQLQAIQQTEGLTDEQKTLVDTALAAVQSLDTTDAEFVSKLEAALAPLT
jgi:hypothetical protein